jgi:hypothetical protein
MINNKTFSIIISIILTALIISVINVGVNLVLNQPEYNDFCNISSSIDNSNITQEFCEKNDGIWYSNYSKNNENYCDFYTNCSKFYNDELDSYHIKQFYIFIALGFIFLILGIFINDNLIQLTGLLSGGVLIIQSVTLTSSDKFSIFIILLGVLISVGVFAWRKLKEKK